MDHGQTFRQGRLSYLDSQTPLPAVADLALRVAVTLTKWSQRRQTRLALKRLSADQLDDIGLKSEQAWREAALPFWRN